MSSHQSRAEFLVGAWVINEIVPRRISPDGLLGNLQPQMLRTADILGAGGPLDAENPRDDEGHFLNAVLEPRRSAKTTSIWCVTIGRCWMRPVYMAAYTMLTLAKKADERFSLDVRDTIKRKWKDPKTRPIKVLDGKGSKGLEFPNGSKLSVLAPTGDDVRSGGYDLLVLDEAGEPEPDVWDDVVGAVVPSFDTRPGAQLVYAGTGGKYRDGSHFWTTLHDLNAGRIRYGVADDISEAALASWEAGAGELIDALHPGLDGLTKLATIRQNFALLGAARFALEYLGHFGKALGNDTVIDTTSWADTTERGPVPTGVTSQALAFAVHPGGLWASIAVAWYLPDDGADLAATAWALDGDDSEAAPPRIGFKLLHHQEGNANLDRKLWQYVKMLRLPIAYDGGSAQEKDVIQQLNRVARPRPQTRPLAFAEKAVSHTRLLNGITHATVAHWEQAPMDKAAAGATKRMAGKSVLFGIPNDDPGFDITPLEAVAAAMYALPDPSAGEAFGPIVVS
ncbi:hypothetical protein [Microbacterium sp. RG1]|uniref:hypothetical protein n=1 Tax=Microbacterium sp. RG1 TaxID=2489212 RepID=UPI0010CA4BF8|nr:hypothetical protein [Microbacterium sp. RG1]QCQ16994.1 hypothetical protein EHF32_09830 [Microbacterium sp. RG1]